MGQTVSQTANEENRVLDATPDPQPFGFDGLGFPTVNGTYTNEAGQTLVMSRGFVTSVTEPG